MGLLAERSAAQTSAPPADIRESREPTPQLAASIRQTLGRIQSLINERKNLYDSTRSKVHGVSFSLRPLVTAEGQSLDALRQRAANANSATEQADTDRSLREIENLLAEDIKLLKRVSKL